jgi:purine nucleosidase
MAIMLDRELCHRSSEHYVEIETSSELTRGMTVVDRLDVAQDPRNQNVWAAAVKRRQRTRVCWELDIARWKAALLRALK